MPKPRALKRLNKRQLKQITSRQQERSNKEAQLLKAAKRAKREQRKEGEDNV